jgi:type IV pilus assembly protein PilQ
MGRFSRITLFSLFAACGIGAAICLAVFTVPPKPRPQAAAVVSPPQSASVVVIRPTTSTTEVPTALTIKPIGGTHLWATDDTVWDAPAPVKPAPPAQNPAPTTLINDLRSPQPIETADSKRTDGATLAVAADDRLAGMNSGSIEPVAYSAASRTLTTPRVEDLPRPAPFWPADDARPLDPPPSSSPNVVAAQASEPPNPITDSAHASAPEPTPVVQSPSPSQSATESTAQPGASATQSPAAQSPAPNSPQTKRQVQDGMEQLRKLLESGGNAPRGETVAAPSPASSAATAGGRSDSGHSKSRAKITPVGEGDEHFALDIQDADIRDVLEMIATQGQINILPSNSVKGRVSASLHDVDLDSALAAILKSTGYVTRRHGKFVYVGTSADFQSLEQSLDKVGTRVYHTNYVRASDLQALITPLLTQGVGAISVTAPAEQGIGTDSTKAGGNSFAGGEAVLVRDYEAVLAQIDQVVAEVDKRPMQVAIEAMILSVKLNDSDQFGVNFQLMKNNPHVLLASGSPSTALSDVSLTGGGLNFGFLDTTLGVFLNAVETVGDTHVIATPRVVCLDKQRAEILIGSQLGYISSTVTETSTAQNVNFLEVGTQLRIRPFISSDGLVRMEVHPELSTGQVTTQGGFTLPDKDLTQVTTNVMVRDGATVVIGGLIREDLTTNTTQIPLLGNLPGVGWIFRQKQETTQRNEILVLITPHIVYDCEAATEGARGASEFHRREAVYADQMSPFGKRHLGRRYYRLAQEAFAAGDQPRALRFIDLAIHFDPLNRAAIDLRTDIVTGNHFGEHTAVKFPTVATPSATMVALPQGQEQLPPWMLNQLGQQPGEQVPPPPLPEPEHPLDPGRPGTSTDILRPREFD